MLRIILCVSGGWRLNFQLKVKDRHTAQIVWLNHNHRCDLIVHQRAYARVRVACFAMTIIIVRAHVSEHTHTDTHLLTLSASK